MDNITDGAIGADEDLPPGDSPASDLPPSGDPEPTPRVSADGTGSPAGDHAPVPWKDHNRIVDGHHARYDPVAWASGLDQREVQRKMALAELYESGKLDRRDREPDAPGPARPGPDLQTEDGRKLYSDERAVALAEWVADQRVQAAIAKMEGRLGPLEETHKRSEVLAGVSGTIDAALDAGWPGLDQADNQNAMADAVASANRQDRRLSLSEAYIQVVVPKLAASREAIRAEERTKILAELNATSDDAKGELTPRARPAASRKSIHDMSFAEAMEAEVAGARR